MLSFQNDLRPATPSKDMGGMGKNGRQAATTQSPLSHSLSEPLTEEAILIVCGDIYPSPALP